jgi:Ca-activated chloride channel family protein
MKTLCVLFLLVGTLVACAVSQGVPASPTGPASAPPAAQKAAVPPSFSSPVVPGKANQATKPLDEDQDAIPTFRKRVDEVNVIFTVTDKHGHFIKDLKKDDIRVLDDHKPPSSVVAFRSETDLPLRVGLLIDASNSIRDRFRFEQEAAMYFLSQIVRPKSDEAFVLGFDTTAEVTQDFTDNTEKLAHGVRMLRPGGGTAMYDAVYYACRDKLMKARVSGPARRAIILVSDGEDNQSRVTMSETIEMAQRAEVILYAISTNVSNIKMRGDKVLERMAEATGGRAFFPFKIEDVSNAFAEIQDELRSQYAVAYKPADFRADGRYRSIEIVSDNKKYHVRARKGYYAPTQ